MSLNSNNSLFVKTYGKPRHTQRLEHDSLWHNDMIDDFDRCLGIDDVKQTTFISPESVSSVSIYKFGKDKKKIENKTKTTNSWSMQLHSTLNGNKVNQSVRKRNFECSSNNIYNKKKLLNNASNSKAIKSISTTKLKNKFVLSKEQCSTPFQSSVSYAQSKKLNIAPTSIKKIKKKLVLIEEQHYTPLISCVSTKKKKKKTKLKKNLASSNCSFSSDHSKESDCLYYSNSNLLEEVNDNSVLISGSHLPKSLNTELSSKNNIHFSYHERNTLKKSDLNKPKKLYCNNKKISSSSKEKNSNWYNKVMNIICDNELSFPEGACNKKTQENEEILPLEDIIEDHSFESDNICYTTETKNIMAKPSKQIDQISLSPNLKNLSFQSMEYTKRSSFRKENQNFRRSQDLKESINCNIIIGNSDIAINESQPCVKYNEDELKLYDNSLYGSYHQCDKNKIIENTGFLRDNCLNTVNINANDDLPVKLPKHELKNVELPQINQIKTSPLNPNSICITQNKAQALPFKNSSDLNLNNSHKSFSDNINNKLLKLLESTENNNLITNFNYNQSSLLLYENVNMSENKDDFKSSIVVNVTNKLSNISIDERQHDHFILEDSILEVTDESLKLFVDKSIINDLSSINSSSSLKQDTVIFNDNCSVTYFNKNVDTNVLLNEKSIKALKTSSNYSTNQNIFKCDDINVLNNIEIVSDSTLHTSYDFAEHLFDSTILYPDTFQINTSVKNELCNSNEDFIINQEKHQSSYNNKLSNLFNKSENTLYEKSTNCIQENISNDKLKTSNVTLNVSRRKRYAGRFKNLNLDTIEEFVDENKMDIQNLTKRNLDYTQSTLSHTPRFRLEPGKKWRRSINIVRNLVDGNLDHTNLTQNTTKGRKWISTVDDVIKQQSIDTTINHKLDQSNIFRNSMRYSNLPNNSIGSKNEIARKLIFDICNQKELISFDSWLKPNINKNWKKVGEGVFGEVFWYSVSKSSTVVKIIPIEGQDYINSERQKMMFEVYSEIVIATELNKLFDKYNRNSTNSFCKLKNISCVQGKYPEHLIRLWKQYNNDNGSDNDNPNILPNNQMFIVLEMENGGIDVENFLFNSAYQALYAFLQIVFGLAVAEEQFNFEHRDLHIGNILVKKVASNSNISFKLDGEIFNVPSKGVKITIIDFTLSRMTYNNKSIFNNLAEDAELFTSDGDYQFEIYRLMREETNDQWNSYKPKTNIYWLHYVLDKMLESVHYKKTTTIVHSTGISILLNLKNSVLSFNSAKSLSESKLILNLLR